MTRRKSNAGANQTDRAALQQLSDEALDVLLAIIHVLGTRRTWPGWAHAALGTVEPAATDRTQFRRMMRRAWPKSRWQMRDALRVLAGALGVPLPAAPRRVRPAPPARAPRVRTRWAGQGPGVAPDRTAGTDWDGAGCMPDAEPAAAAEAAAQERARRHNNRPGVWTPAASLAEALHEERGWS